MKKQQASTEATASETLMSKLMMSWTRRASQRPPSEPLRLPCEMREGRPICIERAPASAREWRAAACRG
eukprot:7396846-Pyramimonas_sp.AAC.1